MSRVHVDWTRCDGHGACVEQLPELFTVDDWGLPVSRSGERDPVLPHDLRAEAARAVRTCPLLALRVVEGVEG